MSSDRYTAVKAAYDLIVAGHASYATTWNTLETLWERAWDTGYSAGDGDASARPCEVAAGLEDDSVSLEDYVDRLRRLQP